MIALINANALHIPLEDNSVHVCVTSPPYYALRIIPVQPPGKAGMRGVTTQKKKLVGVHHLNGNKRKEPEKNYCTVIFAASVAQPATMGSSVSRSAPTAWDGQRGSHAESATSARWWRCLGRSRECLGRMGLAG